MSARPKPAFHSLRRFERHLVDMPGTAFFPFGTASIQVLDLSFGGARIELPMYAEFGQTRAIRALRIARVLQLRVVCRWSRDRQAGVEFLSPEQARRGIERVIALASG